VTEIQNV
jgi:hypothetical protein